MSATACFITAVLAVTAFTSASSCPTTGICELPPVVYTPDNVDIFIFFDSFNKVQVVEFFRQNGMTEIVSLYELYRTNGDELSKMQYMSALYEFYKQNPGKIVTDCRGIQDFIVGRRWDLEYDDSTEFDILYTSLGDDIFYFFEKRGSYEIVVEFFRKKDMLSVLDLYTAWNDNRLDKTLEIRYRAALYEFYRNNTSLFETVCDDFTVFIESRSSSSSLLSIDASIDVESVLETITGGSDSIEEIRSPLGQTPIKLIGGY